VLLTPEAAAITALSFLGLAVSARSLQLGEAVGVIAVTSAAANLSTIASGLVVFGEPLPDSDLGVALRLLAFALVVLAAALTPGPGRPARGATRTRRRRPPRRPPALALVLATSEALLVARHGRRRGRAAPWRSRAAPW
jgi:hypothetical protein